MLRLDIEVEDDEEDNKDNRTLLIAGATKQVRETFDSEHLQMGVLGMGLGGLGGASWKLAGIDFPVVIIDIAPKTLLLVA